MRALVITGDGARGAFQAGVLGRLPFVPDAVYGTSCGAINATLFSYCTARELQAYWQEVDGIFGVYRFNWLAALWRPGVFHSDPIERKARELVKRRPRCRVVVATTNLVTGETLYVDNRDPNFPAAVAASATIPGLATTDHPLSDGGLRVMAPITRALDDGHRDIDLLMSRPWGPVLPGCWEPRFPWAASHAAFRAIDIMLHAIGWYNIQEALPRCRSLTVWAPERPLDIGLLDFSPVKIAEAMEAGRACLPLVIGLGDRKNI